MGILTNTHPNKSKVVTLSYKKYWLINLTDHFKVWEFRCKDGTDPVKIDWLVVNALEAARKFFDLPLHITSAYRTESYNRKIGGAPGSYHTKGRAVDCYIGGLSPSLLAKFFEAYGMNGIGCYYDDLFVHVDSRENNFFWKNQGCVKVQTHLQTVRKGDSGRDVKDLQYILNLHGEHLSVDGEFGEATYSAVKRFQKEQDLEVDGIVGKNTWKKLFIK